MEHQLPYGSYTFEINPNTGDPESHVHKLEMGSVNFSTYALPTTPVINVTMTQEQLDYLVQKVTEELNKCFDKSIKRYLCRTFDNDLK